MHGPRDAMSYGVKGHRGANLFFVDAGVDTRADHRPVAVTVIDGRQLRDADRAPSRSAEKPGASSSEVAAGTGSGGLGTSRNEGWTIPVNRGWTRGSGRLGARDCFKAWYDKDGLDELARALSGEAGRLEDTWSTVSTAATDSAALRPPVF